jgi:PelA/Pel-15E family pectate lyase
MPRLRIRTRPVCWIALALACPILWPGAATAQNRVGGYLTKADDWFAGDEARKVVANLLSWQSPLGGWPKNLNTAGTAYAGDPDKLSPTFDNGSTTDELRFLARIYKATQDDLYRKAFERGLDYILKAQYPNGGWPQFYPPPKTQYNRYITFNDNAMVRLMLFLREVHDSELYRVVADDRRAAAGQAFGRGIECILKCQVKVDGKLTAWCAQHDEQTFEPRPARTYELVSLSGSESVGIVRLLMSLDHPSPAVVQAVDAAVAWLDSVRISGIRQTVQRDEEGRNKVIVQDPAAPPLWARFYEIGTNRPFFCDRDGVKKYSIAEIGRERRNGYAWYGTWPQTLIEQQYPNWKQKRGK